MLSCYRKGRGVSGWIRKERIEFDVVVWRIEAGMIENIERLNVEFQFKPLFDREILEKRHIHALSLIHI